MKNFLSALTFIVGTAATAVLIWGFLYLCIPGVKDNTDKLLKWGDYKVEEKTTNPEDEIHEVTATTYKFENDFIAITLG